MPSMCKTGITGYPAYPSNVAERHMLSCIRCGHDDASAQHVWTGILYDSFDIAKWASDHSRRADAVKLFPADKSEEVKRCCSLLLHLNGRCSMKHMLSVR